MKKVNRSQMCRIKGYEIYSHGDKWEVREKRFRTSGIGQLIARFDKKNFTLEQIKRIVRSSDFLSNWSGSQRS